MKRLRVILLYLMLGAVVNVGVAWACAVLSPFTNLTLHKQTHDYFINYWLSHHPETYPPNAAQVYDENGENGENGFKGFGIQSGTLSNVVREREYEYILMFSATGWPMLSLRGCIWISYPKTLLWNGYFVQNRSDGTIPLFVEQEIPYHGLVSLRMLPLRPITFGFLANTLFYAGLLWLLITCVIALRHMFRRKPGLCVKCGYDLRGAEHEACPECGEQVAHPSPN